ncbi:MAG TPA: hypothetical protein ENH12_05920 [Proteobacteria bacterium]|nr:hypothetical protein [Pseudomonadota bacterium]
MIIKKILINSLLVLGAVVFSLLVTEGISRIVFSPDDYLKPELLKDRFGVRIQPNSAGHDAWGFRNKSVPRHADIVAIGDSNTYGIAAIASESWPSLLQKQTGRVVYNLGMPGYDTVGYAHLLKDRAISLNPSIVIIGFYLGNDPWGTYKTVYLYGLNPDLKDPDFVLAPGDDHSESKETATPDLSLWADIRLWFGRNSVLFNLARDSDAIRFLYDRLPSAAGKSYVILEDHRYNIHTVLQPESLRAVNLDDPTVREGLRISLEIISGMNNLCRSKGIEFLVVLIPSKIAVYSEYIKDGPDERYHQELIESVEYERLINEWVQSYFQKHNISYLDTLGPLRGATHREQVYPGNADTHPNHHGYKIIAEVIARYLDHPHPPGIEEEEVRP